MLLASALAVPAIIAITSQPIWAASQYWDINSTNTGATDDGGGSATGVWDATTTNWTADSTGVAATVSWTSGSTSVFSAGTNASGSSTITVTGAKTVAGMTFEEGILNFSGDQITLTTATLNTTANVTIGNVIGGTVGVTKTSTGTLTLSGNNIYGGTTTVTTGILNLTGSNTLTGATTVNAGTLNLDYTVNNNNKINPAGILTLGNGSNLNILGANGAANTSQSVASTSLTANGASNITVTTGDTQNATLALGAITRGAAAVTNFNTVVAGPGVASITTTNAGTNGILGGYATLNGSDWAGLSAGSIVAPTYATDDYSASTNNTDVTTDQSPAAGTAVNSLRFNTGQATVSLSGANSITTGGILVTSAVGGNSTTVTGGTLSTSASDFVVIQNNPSGSFTLGSSLTGTAGLTKAGPGTLILTGTNTNTGAYTVDAGTLQLGVSESINDTSALVVDAGATFDMNGQTETVGSLGGAGSINMSANLQTGGNVTAATFSGILAGGGTLTKTGTGTQTLSGANTYTGPTLINAGVVAISTATGLGTVDNGTTVASGAALQITGAVLIAEPLTLSGTGIANAGALRKTAANNTTFSGGITLNADSRINSDANTLLFTAADINNNGFNLTLGGAGNISLTAKITGAGSLTKDGTGNLILANNNSNYTGKTIINAGTVTYNFQVGTGVGPLGPNPTTGVVADFITLNGGTLVDAATGNAGTALDPNKGITVGANGGTYSLTDPTVANVHIYRAPITGPGSLTKAGVGTLAFTGTFTYLGATNITGGILRIRQEGTSPNFVTGSLPATTTLNISSAATFDMASFNQTIDSLNGAGSLVGNASAALLTISGTNPAPASFSGNITSTTGIATTMKLTKNGSGTQILSGTNLNTGAITVSGGILEFSSALSLGGTGANMTVNTASTAAAGYAIDQSFLGRITSSSAGVAALAANSSNNLDLSSFSSLSLGAVGSANYSGTLTPGSSYRLGGGGGVLTLTNPITDSKDLSIDSNGTSGGTIALTGTNRFGSLTIGTGKLDLSSNHLILTNTPQSTLRGLLLTGRNETAGVGLWNGNGVISSTAAADPNKLTAIGYLTAGDLGISSWDTVSGLSSTDVVTLLTTYGDINLDGKVNRDDLALLDRGFAKYSAGQISPGQAVWLNGDFNYDGAVTSADYLLMDKTLAANGLLSPDILSSQESQFGSSFVSQVVSSVPEPTSLALIAAATPLLSRRRRNAR
jgi:autotransporter-associated beta strand protein